jgi:phenylpropionate dioxygenase-like ring-hydroxylating dioxygenase large terminal subunit
MGRQSANAPFLRNAWYIAAWDDELSSGLMGRTIMNEPIAFFRDSSGRVCAVEDRCCHRGAALTDGRVIEKGLQCGYHGLVFDGTGKCVEIPGQDSIPPMARIKHYPVVERQEFIWIWMGDPALADESQIIDWPYHLQPQKYPHRKCYLPIKANFLMMIDNLMDLTHLGYVHSKTIGGNPLSHVNAQMNVERTAAGCMLTRWMLNVPPPPTYLKGVPFPGRVDRWQEFEYVLPGSVLQWSGALDVGKGAQQDRRQPGVHIHQYHGITPETETTSHYLWSTGIGYRQDDPSAIEDMFNETYPTFLEDQAIMANQQARRAYFAAYEDEQQAMRQVAE